MRDLGVVDDELAVVPPVAVAPRPLTAQELIDDAFEAVDRAGTDDGYDERDREALTRPPGLAEVPDVDVTGGSEADRRAG
jgi:hypothetical protein